LTVSGELPACGRGGTLVIALEMRKGSLAYKLPDVGKWFTAHETLGGGEVPCRPVLGSDSHAAPWQAWRIPIEASLASKPVRVSITSRAPADVALACRGYFLPK